MERERERERVCNWNKGKWEKASERQKHQKKIYRSCETVRQKVKARGRERERERERERKEKHMERKNTPNRWIG